MKKFIGFFAIISMIFVTSCVTKNEIVENNYFVWTDGEYVQVENDPMIDKEVVIDNENKVQDEDNFVENDSTGTENEDSDFVEQPDSDIVIDYCENMVDLNSETMARDYSDGDNSADTKTILTIKLNSLSETCLIKFYSTSISSLNGFSVEAISMPIKKKQVSFEGKDCYLYLGFVSNRLKLELIEISTLKTLFDQSFAPK